jgi:hypothetical protein
MMIPRQRVPSRAREGAVLLLLLGYLLPYRLQAQGPAETTSTVEVSVPGSNRGKTSRAPHLGTERDTAGPHVFAGLGHQGFRLESADSRQSLHIQGLFSARGSVSIPQQGEVTYAGSVRLARFALSGNLAGEELTYYFQAGFEGTPQLLDMELMWSPFAERLKLRFGRIRVPFARQWITGLGALALPDRAVASDYFRPGRDTGVTVESQWLDRIELRAGAYAEETDRWPRAAARVAYAPLGMFAYNEDVNRVSGPVRFQMGLGANYNKGAVTSGGVTSNTAVTSGAIDFALRAGPVAAFAEAYIQRREVVNGSDSLAAGGFAQVGAFVLPAKLELVARFDMIAPNVRDEGVDGLRRAEGGLAGYILDGALKIQPRYSYTQIQGAPVVVLNKTQTEGHFVDVQFVLTI